MKKNFFYVFTVGVCCIVSFRYIIPSLRKRVVRTVASDQFFVPDFDEKRFSENRKQDIKNLVNKAVTYMQKNSLAKTFNAFSYDKNFSNGELYLFAYDTDGVCLAIGEHRNLLWQNLYDHKDSYGTFIVRSIIEKAKKGGGWIVYEWKNATKLSYIMPVKKNGKTYAVGCGFYPHSKRDAVVNLVNGAVSFFNEGKSEGDPIDQAFSRFNYALGSFVFGDLYLFALGFDGNIMAQGDRPGLIGQNVLEYKDENGKFLNKEIINKLKKSDNGIWVEYVSKRASKKTYARKVTDAAGKNYFIACGYYPTADRKSVVDLVRSGFRYLEMHGVSQSVEEFTEKRNKKFKFGDLYIFLYDMKGKTIAHGYNPDFVGTNRLEVVDDTGRYYVRDMIKKAKAGGGWIDYKIRNSSRFVYVEEVEIGAKKYVIGSGLHPISKPEMMQLLVKGGKSLLEDVSKEEAFGQFIAKDSEFLKGDLSLFVFDFDGICYAFGQNFNLIWRDMSNIKDDAGVPYIKKMIKTVKDGAGTISYKLGGHDKIAYLEKVKKDGMNFVIGSSFYL